MVVASSNLQLYVVSVYPLTNNPWGAEVKGSAVNLEEFAVEVLRAVERSYGVTCYPHRLAGNLIVVMSRQIKERVIRQVQHRSLCRRCLVVYC